MAWGGRERDTTKIGHECREFFEDDRWLSPVVQTQPWFTRERDGMGTRYGSDGLETGGEKNKSSDLFTLFCPRGDDVATGFCLSVRHLEESSSPYFSGISFLPLPGSSLTLLFHG